MPIYEYQCAKCKKVHEIWQKITEPNATKCPACGGKIERLISASGFALKGTGWYKTDYERKGKKDLGGASSGDSDSTKSETKPDSTPDSGSSEKKKEPSEKKKKDGGSGAASEKKKDSGGSDKKAQAA